MALLYSTKLPPEWEAVNFTLTSTTGKKYTLSEQVLNKGIVIVFTCNHCSYAKASWPLLVGMHNKYASRGIDFIAINPNDTQEFPEDSFAKMKEFVTANKIPFPYLYDEDQKVARTYQAQCTPDLYLFTRNLKLFYHGRINDNWQNPQMVTRHDLQEAIDRLLIGDQAPIEQFPSMGCSIKWKS